MRFSLADGKYKLAEEKRPGQYFDIADDEKGSYILNPKDLALIEYISRIDKRGSLFV
ncbi:MAG: U32 family peptidase [Bacillus subtilis]|nr:U32 family peptidase [Bacillus subtilis]